MVSKITSQIKVSVHTEYDERNSFPSENRYAFRYNVYIENLGDESVTLLKRKWTIYDIGFGFTEIEGEGVIGLTPVIEPGETFKYFSNVILRSGIGTMYGSYMLSNRDRNVYIDVEIPKFNLISSIFTN